MLEHQHLIIRAEIKNPPTSTAYIESWLCDLVADLNMKIMMGPFVAYSHMVGNRGLTGVCIIETSHIALHCWDEENPSMLQLDVYSCAPVDKELVMRYIEEFVPVSVDYKFLDRKDKFIALL